MRARTFILCLAGSGLLTGCFSHRKPPYADDPTLLHYKPTLSDSATILAERQARRGPVAPPMPVTPREETRDNVLPVSAPRIDKLETLKAETPAGPLGPPPGEAPPKQFPSTLPQRPSTAFEPLTPPAAPVAAESVLPPPPPETVSPVVATHSTPPEAPKPAVPVTANGHRFVEGSFGHSDDHRWLQGTLEKHYRGYFCVRFCDPSVEDEFGGKLRLADDRRIEEFQEGDVIGLDGDVMPADPSKGSFASASFRVHDMWLVRKK